MRFQMPARGQITSDKRIRPRQFLILECQGRTGFAYAIEPSRQTDTEHLPVGIVWSPSRDPLTDEDIQDIARDCEIRKRINHSWIRKGAIGSGALQIRAVD